MVVVVVAMDGWCECSGGCVVWGLREWGSLMGGLNVVSFRARALCLLKLFRVSIFFFFSSFFLFSLLKGNWHKIMRPYSATVATAVVAATEAATLNNSLVGHICHTV